jgi:hypothetical protein
MEACVRLRRAGRASGGAALAVALLLCLPADATARPGDEVRPRSLHLTMSAPATRGYTVSVETLGHHRVILTARKGNQSATYMVRGKVSRHRVKADFGRFGRLSLRFRGHPRPFPTLRRKDRKRSAPLRRCRGRRPEREVGRFRGTIEFDGQRGFTRLAVGGLRGELRRSYRQVCRIVARRRGPAVAHSSAIAAAPTFTLALLAARARVGRALVRFSAINLEGPAGIRLPGESLFSLVLASTQEQVGRVRVTRSTFLLADPGEVKISRRGVRPARAKVALDRPFDGSALFRGATDTSPFSWRGDLAVHLPGTGRLPLTGPGFRATLCRVSAFRLRSSCFRRAEANLSAQGSGSHSQPLALARLSSLR